MTSLAGLILAIYQLVGIHGGWYRHRLEQTLLADHNQHTLEETASITRPAQPVAVASQTLTLGAVSVLAVDADTMAPLYSVSPDKQLPIASLTKLATAMVVLKETANDQIITIPTLPSYAADDALLHVAAGEQFRLNQLLAAALIPSANDAADSLAIANSGTITAFSAKMNRLVASWGIRGVHYSNSSGLIDTDNYASAWALARIAKLDLDNPLFASLTSTAHTTITDVSGKLFDLASTNKLFGDPRVSGIKTGFTAAAGQCFVSLATVRGHRIITVVLGSPDRFGETQQLINWVERNYQWQ